MVYNPLGTFFFIILSFASIFVALYTIILAVFLEVPGNDALG